MRKLEDPLQLDPARAALTVHTPIRVSAAVLEALHRLLDEPVGDAAIRMLTKRAPWEPCLAQRLADNVRR